MKKWMGSLLMIIPLLATGEVWRSGPTQTTLIELYTSEGCSSCPPADRWLSALKERPDLFQTFVPVAFHVDYWDYIGWKDRFATNTHAKRQQQYVREGLASQVYTPGIMINSREWRQWFRGQRQWEPSQKSVGVLTSTLEEDQLTVSFEHRQNTVLNVSFLGMGLTSNIQTGENHGKKLTHDFVVIHSLSRVGQGEWELKLPPIPQIGQRRTALAIWVTPTGSQKVLQATGGYLP